MNAYTIRNTMLNAQGNQSRGVVYLTSGNSVPFLFDGDQENSEILSFDDEHSTLGILGNGCCNYIDYNSITNIAVF